MTIAERRGKIEAGPGTLGPAFSFSFSEYEMNIDRKLDKIFEQFGDWFDYRQFYTADQEILRLLANPKELEDSNILIGYLTVTSWAKDKLNERQKLVAFAEEKFADREDKEELLRGLK